MVERKTEERIISKQDLNRIPQALRNYGSARREMVVTGAVTVGTALALDRTNLRPRTKRLLVFATSLMTHNIALTLKGN